MRLGSTFIPIPAGVSHSHGLLPQRLPHLRTIVEQRPLDKEPCKPCDTIVILFPFRTVIVKMARGNQRDNDRKKAEKKKAQEVC